MQHVISWQQYIIYSVFSLLVYYGFIIFKFYQKDLKNLKLQGANQKKNSFTNQGSKFPAHMTNPSPETPQTVLSSVVHDFADELKALLVQSSTQESGKTELLNVISKLLQKYPSLKDSEFQTGITNLIAGESETNCNIRFNAEELASVWY